MDLANFSAFTGFNTQPPEGGWVFFPIRTAIPSSFQHTAARRRLEHLVVAVAVGLDRFNTQPPEGGWQIFLNT